MSAALAFQYDGDPELGARVAKALHRVIDPELALDVVELGLVYGVQARGNAIDVRITMTSPACPVTEHIVSEIEFELRREVGDDATVRVEVVWDPPWGPERLSERARKTLDWD
jgi:metal-sulfur cluster biosynthetic enzyme